MFMTVNLLSLDRLEADFVGAAKRLPREAKRAEMLDAEEVASTARSIASNHSTSIPPTIHTAPGPEGTVVTAGSSTVALAALYEYGNKGGGSGPTFTHPVFGDRNNQVTEARHPFIAPAIVENVPRMKRNADAAVDIALGRYGLRPTL